VQGKNLMREEQMTLEQQGIVEAFWRKSERAAARGDHDEARAWMEGVVELDDANVDAWLRLASLIPAVRERMQCYARALELSPGNAQAKAGLRQARREL
jgi:hypothetical protein